MKPTFPIMVVDTNVPAVAAGQASQASPECVTECRERLLGVKEGRARLVLDEGGEIFRQYRTRLLTRGQPGFGVEFVKWVNDFQYNPDRCQRVPLHHHAAREFEEFPDDPDLATFDRDDRKFAAAARVAGAPVLNATDSDWWDFRRPLARQGVEVDFVCADQVSAWKATRPQRA